MRNYLKFYIDGRWVEAAEPKTLEVINPATEAVCGHIALGSAADVDRAVKGAAEAFKSFSRTSRKERLELLEAIVAELE
jgi:aldehyde dehydrogenase (NAD+)